MESAATKVPNRGYHAIRIVVAVLLLTASGLKCLQLSTEPIIEDTFLDSRWVLMATVEFELLFGFWLLANLWARATWAAATACFALFTCVSVCKAFSGHATCGCFGRVPVNPWYTGTLDLLAVLSLLRWRPMTSTFSVRRVAVVGLLWLGLGIPAAYAMGTYVDTTLSDAGEVIGDGTVVLQPKKWIGKRFPLLRYTDIGRELLRGEWSVLFYHHNCPNCRATIQRLHATSRPRRLALIEVPPYGSVAEIDASPHTTGRLDDSRQWFLKTPVEITLREGFVVSF